MEAATTVDEIVNVENRSIRADHAGYDRRNRTIHVGGGQGTQRIKRRDLALLALQPTSINPVG